jgi:glycosyltransferase involved in cell wall biosynthesis
MTLGVFIIAKNEEARLPGLLSVLNEFAEQIIVVDTGSSDDTYLTAAKYGCEVYFSDWKDDFSYARNLALRHMRTDWVLSLDCDEMLEYEEMIKIRELISNTDADAINLKIINNLSNGIKSVHRYTRLFRNLKYLKYSGRIHEQIRKSIEDNNLKILESDIKILHNGYFENDHKKQMRNKKLLLMDIEENPNDDWLKYHLANTEFSMNNNRDASKLFNAILDSSELTSEQKHMSALRLSQIALVNDDYEGVVKLTDFKSSDKDIEGLRQYILATAKLMMKNYYESDILFRNVIKIKSNLVNYNNVNKAIKIIKNKLS